MCGKMARKKEQWVLGLLMAWCLQTDIKQWNQGGLCDTYTPRVVEHLDQHVNTEGLL